MNNIFNNSYDSENDERLDKKFSYNYQVIKNVYPQVSELPEDEVREIIRKYYDATGTHEDSMQAVMNYIREKEPEWKRQGLLSKTTDDSSEPYLEFNGRNLRWMENGEEKRVYTYSFEELEKSRQASRKKMYGQDSPAWLNYRNDMYLKCGVRKALKIAMAKISISNTIQALFDDEMQDIPSPAPVASQKTADFASQMEEAERIDEEFRKEQFAQLKEQFDYRNQENDL